MTPRLVFSRGTLSFDVTRVELKVSGFTLTDRLAETAWLLDDVHTMEVCYNG